MRNGKGKQYDVMTVDVAQAYFDALPVWVPILNAVGGILASSVPTDPHKYQHSSGRWMLVGHPDVALAYLNPVEAEPESKGESVDELAIEIKKNKPKPKPYNRYQRRDADSKARRQAKRLNRKQRGKP